MINRSTLLENPNAFLWVYLLLTLFVTVQAFLLGTNTFGTENAYTFYNNYVIFKQSYFHLINGQDLYILHPTEQFDLYKYSPTFALIFGLLAYFPDELGLFIWNALNSITLFYAIRKLDFISTTYKNYIYLFLIPELLTSLQNEQSNGLIAALFIFAFVALEKKQTAWAAFCVVFSGFIKIFGFAGLALFVLYPQRLTSALWLLVWMLVFALIPFVVIDLEQYIFLLESWKQMLAADHAGSIGFSIMAWLEIWFHLHVNKTVIVLLGLITLALSFIRIKQYEFQKFRFYSLISLLIWVVIFNHKAESPTFIIALTGVCLWFFTIKKPIAWHYALFLSVMILTSLSSTDLFPLFVREQYIKPWVIKVVPCVWVWFVISYRLIWKSFSDI